MPGLKPLVFPPPAGLLRYSSNGSCNEIREVIPGDFVISGTFTYTDNGSAQYIFSGGTDGSGSTSPSDPGASGGSPTGFNFYIDTASSGQFAVFQIHGQNLLISTTRIVGAQTTFSISRTGNDFSMTIGTDTFGPSSNSSANGTTITITRHGCRQAGASLTATGVNYSFTLERL